MASASYIASGRRRSLLAIARRAEQEEQDDRVHRVHPTAAWRSSASSVTSADSSVNSSRSIASTTEAIGRRSMAATSPSWLRNSVCRKHRVEDPARSPTGTPRAPDASRARGRRAPGRRRRGRGRLLLRFALQRTAPRSRRQAPCRRPGCPTGRDRSACVRPGGRRSVHHPGVEGVQVDRSGGDASVRQRRARRRRSARLPLPAGYRAVRCASHAAALHRAAAAMQSASSALARTRRAAPSSRTRRGRSISSKLRAAVARYSPTSGSPMASLRLGHHTQPVRAGAGGCCAAPATRPAAREARASVNCIRGWSARLTPLFWPMCGNRITCGMLARIGEQHDEAVDADPQPAVGGMPTRARRTLVAS